MFNWSRKSIAYLGIIIILVSLAGCGSSPEKQVYDSKANPYGFPREACALLEKIENRQLVDFDSITNAFAGLYDRSPFLLDDDRWHGVIAALGVKFEYFGDQEAQKGIVYYSRAAGYYDLAAFARPLDRGALQKSRLFSAWQRLTTDPAIDTGSLGALMFRQSSARDRIDLVKRFLFGDSLDREFARLHLVDQLLGRSIQTEAASDSAINSFSALDRAFLSYAGLLDVPSGNPVARFADPAIDLVAYHLTPLSEHDYRLELYFVPRTAVTADLGVAVFVDAGDSARSNYLALRFSPGESTSRWIVNSVAAATTRFTFPYPPSQLAVGLFRREGLQVNWVVIAGVADSMVQLPVDPGN